MEARPDLLHVFAHTSIYTDDQEYAIIDLPLSSLERAGALLEVLQPFAALVVDKDELTVVVPTESWEVLGEQFPEAAAETGYRLITLDLPLELGLVGYIAMLTDVVARAGVSLLVFSAYQRDHLLVPDTDFQRAIEALERWISACQQQTDSPECSDTEASA